MIDVSKFKGIRVSIASPEKIRSWSYGEVKKPETINYRTLKPERDGLFCEKIFGPTKDYECSCGKYKRLRYKNIVCDRCGVEVTLSKVRRERMGHIELAAPCSHIWFFKGVPSKMGLVLDMSPRDLEEVLYFVSYVVLDPGPAPLEKKQTISDKEYRAYYEKYGNTFRVGMGAEAIKELLRQVDIDKEVENLRKELENATGQKRIRLVKRLGYEEGLPVVVDPGIIKPRDFIDEVVNIRIPNPFMPDTPQRIACDTSQKIPIRFGETIKAYRNKSSLGTEKLKVIPVVLAGYLRYLEGVDDEGNVFEQSPDPLLDELKALPAKEVLKRKDVFGVDLYQDTLAKRVLEIYAEMQGKGNVRKELELL